ncbi:MAG: Helix-turn-helix domain [Chloroflexota bacterium]|nr:Helix-turn-helix domain [Chloroflexota bacterium]
MGAAMGDETAEGVDPIQRRVGAAIASARASARLSQERLAAEAGLGQPVISRIEAGRRRVGVDELLRIAAALGVDAGELLVVGSADGDETVLEQLRDPLLAVPLGWVLRFLDDLERLERLERLDSA